MAVTNVIELLVKIGVLDDRQHDAVMTRARSGAGGDLVRAIGDQGFATESTIARVLSVELGLPRVDLAITPPEHEALGLLDLKTCVERFVLPVALRENGEMLWLAMGDPTDTEAMALVRRKTNKRVRPVVAGPSEIVREARRLYQLPQTPGGPLSMTNALPGSTQPSGGIELTAPPDNDEKMEIVNVMDESSAPSPAAVQRLADQLGVAVPESVRRRMPVDEGVEINLSGDPADASDTMVDAKPVPPAFSKPPPKKAASLPARPAPAKPPPLVAARVSSPPPPKPGRGMPPPPPPESDADQVEAEIGQVLDSQLPDPLAPLPARPWPYVNDLAPEDVLNLEALRSSMEKGALVLRALAELCVEKNVFTREEMRRKNKT